MGKVIDIIGKKFGKLTVLDIHSERGNRGQIRYECKCDCGNINITSGESIRSGKVKVVGVIEKIHQIKKITERLLFVSKLLTQGFEADEAFLDTVSLINEAEKSLDFTIPMLVYENGRYKFVNTAKGIPELDTNSLIEALVSAKIYGISCYDEATAPSWHHSDQQRFDVS